MNKGDHSSGLDLFEGLSGCFLIGHDRSIVRLNTFLVPLGFTHCFLFLVWGVVQYRGVFEIVLLNLPLCPVERDTIHLV